LEEERAAEAARLLEEKRAAETARLLEEKRAAEAARLLEEKRAVETARLLEEKRAVETARLLEEKRAVETARLLEEERAAEAARLLEEERAAEAARLLEEERAAEAARLLEEERAAGAARLLEEEAARLEEERVAEAAEAADTAEATGAVRRQTRRVNGEEEYFSEDDSATHVETRSDATVFMWRIGSVKVRLYKRAGDEPAIIVKYTSGDKEEFWVSDNGKFANKFPNYSYYTSSSGTTVRERRNFNVHDELLVIGFNGGDDASVVVTTADGAQEFHWLRGCRDDILYRDLFPRPNYVKTDARGRVVESQWLKGKRYEAEYESRGSPNHLDTSAPHVITSSWRVGSVKSPEFQAYGKPSRITEVNRKPDRNILRVQEWLCGAVQNAQYTRADGKPTWIKKDFHVVGSPGSEYHFRQYTSQWFTGTTALPVYFRPLKDGKELPTKVEKCMGPELECEGHPTREWFMGGTYEYPVDYDKCFDTWNSVGTALLGYCEDIERILTAAATVIVDKVYPLASKILTKNSRERTAEVVNAFDALDKERLLLNPFLECCMTWSSLVTYTCSFSRNRPKTMTRCIFEQAVLTAVQRVVENLKPLKTCAILLERASEVIAKRQQGLLYTIASLAESPAENDADMERDEQYAKGLITTISERRYTRTSVLDDLCERVKHFLRPPGTLPPAPVPRYVPNRHFQSVYNELLKSPEERAAEEGTRTLAHTAGSPSVATPVGTFQSPLHPMPPSPPPSPPSLWRYVFILNYKLPEPTRRPTPPVQPQSRPAPRRSSTPFTFPHTSAGFGADPRRAPRPDPRRAPRPDPPRAPRPDPPRAPGADPRRAPRPDPPRAEPRADLPRADPAKSEAWRSAVTSASTDPEKVNAMMKTFDEFIAGEVSGVKRPQVLCRLMLEVVPILDYSARVKPLWRKFYYKACLLYHPDKMGQDNEHSSVISYEDATKEAYVKSLFQRLNNVYSMYNELTQVGSPQTAYAKLSRECSL
jgi:hypothetical protein